MNRIRWGEERRAADQWIWRESYGVAPWVALLFMTAVLGGMLYYLGWPPPERRMLVADGLATLVWCLCLLSVIRPPDRQLILDAKAREVTFGRRRATRRQAQVFSFDEIEHVQLDKVRVAHTSGPSYGIEYRVGLRLKRELAAPQLVRGFAHVLDALDRRGQGPPGGFLEDLIHRLDMARGGQINMDRRALELAQFLGKPILDHLVDPPRLIPPEDLQSGWRIIDRSAI